MQSKMMIALVAGLLAACSSTSGSKSSFPEPTKARPVGGTYINLDDLRQYAPGMNKRQLYSLLGTPHFNEGMGGVREWNYLFNFRRSIGAEPIQCQFKILFDKHDIARDQAWSPSTCAALLEPPAPPPPPPAPAAAPVRSPLRISTDTLFGFDSAKLSNEGRNKLEQTLRGAMGHSSSVQITVVGYTDRLGSDGYNLRLSQQRAQTIKDLLVQLGLPAAGIQAIGRGKAEPLVECRDIAGKALIDCLAPNRRVEISGMAAE